MRLVPALKIDGKIISGVDGDTHMTISADHPQPLESTRGFLTPDGQFLGRQAALVWLRKNDVKSFRVLPTRAYHDGLHSEHLIKVYGTAKPVMKAPKEETKALKLDLSEKTAVVYDRGGLYLYCAEKLAEKYKKVMYYLADSDAYPTSQKQTIGGGIKGVKRIHDFWKHVDEADCVYFFDCYDGELQHWLRSKGYTVFGSGRGEQIEIDKILFLEKLEEFGLPCPKTYLAEGVDDLCEYLKANDGETLFLKNLHRGDFESRKFTSMAQSRPFLNDLKKRLGSASDTVEVLVQHKIDSACEAGWDGFLVDGEYVPNGMCGYEAKDKGYIGVVLAEKPEIIKQIDDAFAKEFKKLGYRCNYSNEIRITKDGTPYYIDCTARIPSPPGELMCEFYDNWAEATYQIARGEVPELKPKAKYGAEIVLVSGWHEHHEVHVKFPAKYKQHVKLKNHTVRDGEYYCIENGNGGFFGAVVAWGNSIEEAAKKCLEIAETIEADELEYDATIFDKVNESIEAGEKFGISFK